MLLLHCNMVRSGHPYPLHYCCTTYSAMAHFGKQSAGLCTLINAVQGMDPAPRTPKNHALLLDAPTCNVNCTTCHMSSMWQGGEQQGSRHGADLTPSPRTGAIVDALLEGVVSDNLATGDTPQRARQQPPQTHMHGAQQGASQTLLQRL